MWDQGMVCRGEGNQGFLKNWKYKINVLLPCTQGSEESQKILYCHVCHNLSYNYTIKFFLFC